MRLHLGGNGTILFRKYDPQIQICHYTHICTYLIYICRMDLKCKALVCCVRYPHSQCVIIPTIRQISRRACARTSHAYWELVWIAVIFIRVSVVNYALSFGKQYELSVTHMASCRIHQKGLPTSCIDVVSKRRVVNSMRSTWWHCHCKSVYVATMLFSLNNDCLEGFSWFVARTIIASGVCRDLPRHIRIGGGIGSHSRAMCANIL